MSDDSSMRSSNMNGSLSRNTSISSASTCLDPLIEHHFRRREKCRKRGGYCGINKDIPIESNSYSLSTQGYSADVSSDSEPEQEISSDGQSSGKTTIPSLFSLIHKRRRKRRRKNTLISPIHKDVDISLTTHMTSSQYDSLFNPNTQKQEESNRQKHQEQRPALALEVLSRLLLSYYEMKNETNDGAQSTQPPIPHHQQKKVYSNQQNRSTPPQTHAHADRLNVEQQQGLAPAASNELDSEQLPYLPSHKAIQPQYHLQKAHSDSSLPTIKLSKNQFGLEDAISLTSTPRLLLEAARPHHVVHANAAFSQLMKDSSSPWFVCPENIPPDRSLKAAIRDMFPALPVVAYPVISSSRSKVSHYLIEVSSSTSDLSLPQSRQYPPGVYNQYKKDDMLGLSPNAPSRAVG